ncbi:MAG TPA: polysaccharide deacetylase family protein, partial [Bacteroidia bacterium]|nr:polysaccharide deacetylase family protein [Bacteroidia bacterium]
MRKIIVPVMLMLCQLLPAQQPWLNNADMLRLLYQDTAYTHKKDRVDKLFAHAIPGHWGEFVKGVDEDLITRKKIIAFTFDACGGKSNKYDNELIDYLRKEKIPATLFVSGKWIDDNLDTFLKLSKDTLFEIENHGLNHKPCSVDGEGEYGIKGTPDVPDAFDEIEANEWKIQRLTGRRPVFYRSATAYTDEACAKIATYLNVTIVSFDVLSGDAVPFVKPDLIVNQVMHTIKPGAIIIMHFNHPEWFTCDAMTKL